MFGRRVDGWIGDSFVRLRNANEWMPDCNLQQFAMSAQRETHIFIIVRWIHTFIYSFGQSILDTEIRAIHIKGPSDWSVQCACTQFQYYLFVEWLIWTNRFSICFVIIPMELHYIHMYTNKIRRGNGCVRVNCNSFLSFRFVFYTWKFVGLLTLLTELDRANYVSKDRYWHAYNQIIHTVWNKFDQRTSQIANFLICRHTKHSNLNWLIK